MMGAQEKVECLRVECDELRLREACHLEAFQRDSDQRVQAAIASYKHLPQEIDSLHVVLDMRMQEMHTLRSKNMELEKQVSEQCRDLLL